jgi:two-component system sensor histidine kinase ArlS
MPLKYRITAWFTALVVCILLLLCGSIYFFSALNRHQNVQKRLVNRALTSAQILFRVPDMDTAMLRSIDNSTVINFELRQLAIFNVQGRLIYDFSDSGVVPLQITDAIRKNTRGTKAYFFQHYGQDAAAIRRRYKNQDYIIASTGFDPEGTRILSQLRIILIISFLVGTGITLLAGYLFSTRLLQPVNLMSRRLGEISSRNLSQRLEGSRNRDELGQLSATINDLLDRLQDSFETQQRFIANASHELSTPLTAISSQLEVSLQKERDNAAYRRVLRSVYEDALHLNQLTHSLLEMAKASGTPSGLPLNPLRLDELLMELPAEIRKADPSYQLQLSFKGMPESEDQLMVCGNKALLRSAFRNMVINACKYSPDHRAELSLQCGPQMLRVRIVDHGPGIPESEHEKIFQPFYRHLPDGAGSTQGFGLGLSLSQRIIQFHKGSIRLESEPGKGSVFIISLPVDGQASG